jgi:hypothetical protein
MFAARIIKENFEFSPAICIDTAIHGFNGGKYENNLNYAVNNRLQNQDLQDFFRKLNG